MLQLSSPALARSRSGNGASVNEPTQRSPQLQFPPPHPCIAHHHLKLSEVTQRHPLPARLAQTPKRPGQSTLPGTTKIVCIRQAGVYGSGVRNVAPRRSRETWILCRSPDHAPLHDSRVRFNANLRHDLLVSVRLGQHSSPGGNLNWRASRWLPLPSAAFNAACPSASADVYAAPVMRAGEGCTSPGLCQDRWLKLNRLCCRSPSLSGSQSVCAACRSLHHC